MALLYAKSSSFEETFYQTSTYPKTKSQRKLFGERFAYRAEQSRMMNLVYDHFTEGTTKDLFIEAATGTGKTLGYLLPMSYLATPENQSSFQQFRLFYKIN